MSLRVHNFENLVRQEATPAQKDLSKDILPFGDGNNFPLRLALLVQRSPTASSCIDTKTDFIKGGGFSDSTLADIQVNGLGEKFGDLHNLNSEAYGLFSGAAILVKYNVKGNISELFSIPFEYCRLGIPDSKGVISKIRVNPYYGTSQYGVQYTKAYDVYNSNPKVVLAQQARDKNKYTGQILYIASTDPLSRFYPVPKYYSCEKWMAIDEAIGGFHKNNIDNGFFQSVLMTLIGDESTPSKHPDDQIWDESTTQYKPDPNKTNGYRLNIEMQKFSGWTKAGNIMVQWAANKDELPVIAPFPATTNSELFKTVQDITTEQIARGTRVPSILANIQSGASLGGDGNQIRASVKLMQQRVANTLTLFERAYKDLLIHFEKPFTGDVSILNYNPFPEMDTLDPLVWAALTPDEQRNWIKKNTKFELMATAPTATPTVQNKYYGVSYTNYPASAKTTAQKAMDFRTKMSSGCGGKAGWEVTQQIIDGKPLSFKTIKRINNFLTKNESFSNQVFSDSCESVLFSGWGGKDMLNWAKTIISTIND